MKKALLLLSIIFAICTSNKIQAQCEPDLINCIDVLDPGQICPMELPSGTLHEEYYQVVTIIPPFETVFGEGIVPLVSIVIDSIINLPPGINVESNADEFFVDTAYCVLLSGTPTATGNYNLKIYVTPYILFIGQPLEGPQQVDDTSLTIKIRYPTEILPVNESIITELRNSPNPFTNFTNIEFSAAKSGKMQASIYDYIGNEILKKEINYRKGNNSFSIDASKLHEGFYFLYIKNENQVYTKKIIKQ